MAELFSDLPDALENTVEIAKRCNIEVKLGKHFLPNFPIPDGMTIDEYFRKVSFDGLEERLAVLLPKDTTEDYEAKRQVYVDRLNFELDIIIQMGFPGYFLIVMDFIQWAKNNGVPVGPGRGRVPVRWWPMCRRSPTSTRWNTTCCSNVSSTRNGSPCPTSTSTSAWTVATG
jgi:DNA polymerase-3 subunit alpha